MATATLPEQHKATATPTPVVVEKKKDKKRYSSSGTRSFQELESGLSKSARKIAKAVNEGLETYLDERKSSSFAKKDGAFRDILYNQSKALRKALPIAAEAPADLLESIADMKSVKSAFKRR